MFQNQLLICAKQYQQKPAVALSQNFGEMFRTKNDFIWGNRCNSCCNFGVWDVKSMSKWCSSMRSLEIGGSGLHIRPHQAIQQNKVTKGHYRSDRIHGTNSICTPFKNQLQMQRERRLISFFRGLTPHITRLGQDTDVHSKWDAVFYVENRSRWFDFLLGWNSSIQIEIYPPTRFP